MQIYFEVAKKYCKTPIEILVFLYLMANYPEHMTIDEVVQGTSISRVDVTSVLRELHGRGFVDRLQMNEPNEEGPLYGYRCKL